MPAENSEPTVGSAVARRVAGEFASLPQVEAVVVSGSHTSEFADSRSDIDLYVYVTEDIPLELRAKIAKGSPRAEIGNAIWEPGDEWIDAMTGTSVDVMYRHVRWMEEKLDRVLMHHLASAGYSTCFWYNVLHSKVLFDRAGWFSNLQDRANQPYPAELRRAVVAKNYPLLRRNQSSYLHQIELAVAREDPVSVNHRVAALLASYFDLLFAVNELPHPGEKRLMQHAKASCAKLPRDMEPQIAEMLASVGRPDGGTVARINALLDGLDALLLREQMVPPDHENTALQT
jgi:predicted nucleotidyltransferase